MYNQLKLLGILTLSLSTLGQAAFLPVCHRTDKVRVNLETQLKKTCDLITEVDLLSLKRVAVTSGVSAFKADDFSGLKNLEILNIRGNTYTSLPEGLFNDLGNLKTLVIISAKLRHYPDDFLEKTPNLEFIHVFANPVRSISESILVRLENLKNVQEIDFDEALQPAEKTRLRRIFPENGKVRLMFN